MLEIILGSAVFILLVVVVFLLISRRSHDSVGDNYLKHDVTELARTVNDLKDKLSDSLNTRLDANHQLMRQTLNDQMNASNRLVADVTNRLAKLDETNRRVVSVADELKTLQNVLQNPKQRGVLGEYFLQTVLENVLPPNRYSMQYKFKNGEIVDAVIHLENNRILPIDGKFSLENYNRFVDEPTAQGREAIARLVKNDLKSRIDETSKYIRPSENTMDFAFMFIPSEAVYYDLLVNKVGSSGLGARDLVEYAFVDKHVIIVSPTSFMAYLQTVLQGLKSLQIEEQAREIRTRVIKLQRHIENHNTLMTKVGSSLATTVNHYNNASLELKKIDKDVVKISGSNEVVDLLSVEKPVVD